MNIKYLLIYWSAISAFAVIITIKDKRAAIKHRYRVSEKALMLTGLLGGAEAMLITMKIIRHKTKHRKFMLGLPAEIILHTGLIIAYIFLTIS